MTSMTMIIVIYNAFKKFNKYNNLTIFGFDHKSICYGAQHYNLEAKLHFIAGLQTQFNYLNRTLKTHDFQDRRTPQLEYEFHVYTRTSLLTL